jgi:hypothetical protein
MLQSQRFTLSFRRLSAVGREAVRWPAGPPVGATLTPTFRMVSGLQAVNQAVGAGTLGWLASALHQSGAAGPVGIASGAVGLHTALEMPRVVRTCFGASHRGAGCAVVFPRALPLGHLALNVMGTGAMAWLVARNSSIVAQASMFAAARCIDTAVSVVDVASPGGLTRAPDRRLGEVGARLVSHALDGTSAAWLALSGPSFAKQGGVLGAVAVVEAAIEIYGGVCAWREREVRSSPVAV